MIFNLCGSTVTYRRDVLVSSSLDQVGEGQGERSSGRRSRSGSSRSRRRSSSPEPSNADIKAAVEQWQREADAKRLSLRPVAVELSPWLRDTQWDTVFAASKHGHLATHQFTRMPDPEETQLSRILGVWEQILTRCLDTLAAVDHKDTLKWWASPQNEAASQRPFELPQNSQTLDKYSRRWQSFLCYVLRTAPEDNWTDDSETGVKFTEGQWLCVDAVRSVLEKEEDERRGERAGEDEAVRGEDPELVIVVMDLIMSLVT